MNYHPSDSRPLDDIDVRVEETEASNATDARIEVATFAEGEHVESILISRSRAAEIYKDLGRILAGARNPDCVDELPNADREVPICPHCGSDSVAADAAARWNTADQVWEVSNVFDKGHCCDDCGAEDIAFVWISENERIERAAAEAARRVETS